MKKLLPCVCVIVLAACNFGALDDDAREGEGEGEGEGDDEGCDAHADCLESGKLCDTDANECVAPEPLTSSCEAAEELDPGDPFDGTPLIYDVVVTRDAASDDDCLFGPNAYLLEAETFDPDANLTLENSLHLDYAVPGDASPGTEAIDYTLDGAGEQNGHLSMRFCLFDGETNVAVQAEDDEFHSSNRGCASF